MAGYNINAETSSTDVIISYEKILSRLVQLIFEAHESSFIILYMQGRIQFLWNSIQREMKTPAMQTSRPIFIYLPSHFGHCLQKVTLFYHSFTYLNMPLLV